MMYPTQRLDVLQHRHDHIDYFSRSEQEVSQENATQTLSDDVELTERTARILFGCCLIIHRIWLVSFLHICETSATYRRL